MFVSNSFSLTADISPAIFMYVNNIINYCAKIIRFYDMAKFIFVCGEKGASVIMLGVALVVQHHVGRGIEGGLVQCRDSSHVFGIDIH